MVIPLSASGLIPAQQTGAQSNTSFVRNADTIREAEQLYENARRRLLDVNNWQEISGEYTAAFTLTDSNGRALRRSALEGDNIRINIPGPGAQTGQGYDWVQIEKIAMQADSNAAYTGMRVRPLPLPTGAGRQVAHFFRQYATSSFVVEKNGNTVRASVYGRNELPNTGVKRLLDKIRNLFISAGAVMGLSKVQWGSLVRGILQ
ncbi:hypothetical protein [Chitinophaga solisilvae]|uniref:hypothetical protein n=1 Tax=Chitinophaga solisilvae TaxID=1233460 RepID=UPI00136DABC4|nr:hypothetical protein [Chitinophaga solisilvae]